jgi:indole-3-glycerol phosphate synthase
MLAPILEQIVAARKVRVQAAEKALPLAQLLRRAEAMPPVRDFVSALRENPPAIIAEVKKGSPSRGLFKIGFDPKALAQAYASGGAAALSVVTEPDFFWGDLAWIAGLHASTSLPILRKDFVFSPYQVWESRAAGADALLLILAMLTDQEASLLVLEAKSAGLQCLVEVHDEVEARRAVLLQPDMVGVNNRDLGTFAVALETSERLATLLPSGSLRVAESGISTQSDCSRLAAHGYGAFLVGEALVTDPDPAARIRALRGGPHAH